MPNNYIYEYHKDLGIYLQITLFAVYVSYFKTFWNSKRNFLFKKN